VLKFLMTSFLLEELVLCGYISGSLLLISLLKIKETSWGWGTKKVFFFLFRTACVSLVMTFLLSLWSFFSEWETLLVDGQTLTDVRVRLVVLYDLPGHGLIRQDLLTRTFGLLLNVLMLFYLFLMGEYFKKTQKTFRYTLELPVLLVTIFLSLKIFLIAVDLILLVLALELAAYCSIILLGLQTTSSGANLFSVEAAIKYFIFNAVGVAFLLFSASGYFSLFASVNLLDVSALGTLNPLLAYMTTENILLFQSMFFFGYLIKLGAAPLHQWVPDVYEGAELFLTALLVLIVGPVLNLKLFMLAKMLLSTGTFSSSPMLWGFLFVGVFSVFWGSFNAFSQTRIKRFLAYTGITHLGFILLSFGTGTFFGYIAAFLYLLFYLGANLVFFSLLIISRQLSGVSLIFLNQLKLIVNQNAFFLLFFVIPLFSYAGFPPFAGFFTKLFALAAIIDLNSPKMVLLLVLLIVFSAYLYLRLVKLMLFETSGYSLLIPLGKAPVYRSYYRLQNYFGQIRRETGYHIMLFFTLFILNLILAFFVLFMPLILTSILTPMISLLLFY